jgi:hypothetical protein
MDVRWLLILVAVAVVVVAASAIGLRLRGPSASEASPVAGASSARETGRPVCGQPMLRSPYSYTGAGGPFRSGTPGLPTFGAPGTDFPTATAGQVIPPETADYQNWQLRPHTVYYLAPGLHIGSFSANTGDVFIGGSAGGVVSVLDGEYARPTAIDSNITIGEQTDVTIRYLTVQRFAPPVDQTAINQTGAGGWTLLDSTVTLNAPGGGMFAATDNVIKDSCLTLNGQYGFQSAATVRGDSLTGGPYNVRVEGNEISYNDTCDLSGLLQNAAFGWRDHNPVPPRFRNGHCGTVQGSGNQGGFKLWATNGVLVTGNWIHHNWGVGGWADTNNANTTWTRNTITDNENAAIVEETSYNFSITDNHLARNNLVDGLGNPGFPMAAVYVSESGSDTVNGGVPGCAMPSCRRAGLPAYPRQSVIRNNTLVDNGGGIFLWQNANRRCNDGSDPVCTLLKGGSRGPFSLAGCAANLPAATLDPVTYRGTVAGNPPQDYWDGCMWQTQNVAVSWNRVDFDPGHIAGCRPQVWPACGANGVFSQYGGPNSHAQGWEVASQITFVQGNHWSDNLYRGPSTFYAWNQGSHENPVSWAQWTGAVSKGNRCTSSAERQSGGCRGPFGQDARSTFQPNHHRSAP